MTTLPLLGPIWLLGLAAHVVFLFCAVLVSWRLRIQHYWRSDG